MDDDANNNINDSAITEGGGQLKREVGEEVVGVKGLGGGRKGREECGRKKYFLCKTNLEPILYHFKVTSDLRLVFNFHNFTV